jgi:hypothetical protein
MSSADDRERHAGISHHAWTALTRVALVKADVPVPKGHSDDLDELRKLHNVVEVEAAGVIAHLGTEGFVPRHMGRGPEDDRLFFLAAGASGLHTGELLKEG